MPKIPIPLEIEPELRARAESVSKRQRGIDGDGASAVDDLIEATIRPCEMLCQGLLAEMERFHEFFQKHLSGVGRGSVFWQHKINSSRAVLLANPLIIVFLSHELPAAPAVGD